MTTISCHASGARCRQGAQSNVFFGGYLVNRPCALVVMLMLSCCCGLHARSVPELADYCPTEPATGLLTLKSVDGANSACVPGHNDSVGQAIFQCWKQFTINVNGCQVTMHTTVDQAIGPGRMPCRMFAISGNLSGEGVEAQMWAEVDGPGLLSYYYSEPEAVKALSFDNFRQLVSDIWAFMRAFTGDPRFDDDAWIYGGSFLERSGQSLATAEGLPRDPQLQSSQGGAEEKRLSLEQRRSSRRRQLERAMEPIQDVEVDAAEDEVEKGKDRLGWAPQRRKGGPMRVYRSSEARVVVKMPTGCKYRYTVNPDSHVFETPTRRHAHVQWHIILIVAATFSVVLSVVGLGTCTYFSRKHAEYVASYWEYQAVKDQLGSELPPSLYVRLFGAQPKSAAAPAPGAGPSGPAAAPTGAEAAPPVLLPSSTTATAATKADAPPAVKT